MSAAAPGTTPVVLVVVGTDCHPFDRLVDWVERWQEARGGTVRCVVQHGSSRAPRSAEGRPYLGYGDLQEAMAEATAVVTHGGPASITEARSHGHRPVCVPRDPARGEHVDGHQQRFARRLAEGGLVTLAETETEFAAALDALLDRPRSAAPVTAAGAARPAAVIRIGQLLVALTAGAAAVRS